MALKLYRKETIELSFLFSVLFLGEHYNIMSLNKLKAKTKLLEIINLSNQFNKVIDNKHNEIHSGFATALSSCGRHFARFFA